MLDILLLTVTENGAATDRWIGVHQSVSGRWSFYKHCHFGVYSLKVSIRLNIQMSVNGVYAVRTSGLHFLVSGLHFHQGNIQIEFFMCMEFLPQFYIPQQ